MGASSNKGALTAVIAVAMALGGYAVGYQMGGTKGGGDAAKAEGYREGMAAAKAKVDASGAYLMPHLTSLTGKVTATGSGTMDIQVAQTVSNPLAEQAPLVRHVTLANGATIVRATQKSDAAVFKDLADYEKAVKAAQAAGKEPPAPPLSYDVETITLADVRVGDEVIVESASDIAMTETIMATSVRVVTQTAAPAPSAGTAPELPPGRNNPGPVTTAPESTGPATKPATPPPTP